MPPILPFEAAVRLKFAIQRHHVDAVEAAQMEMRSDRPQPGNRCHAANRYRR